MQVSKATRLWLNYHKANSRSSTVQSYEGTISKLVDVFGRREMDAVTTEDVQEFLEGLTEGCKQQTKKIRYSHVKAFFNFIRNNLDSDLINPCDNPVLKKLFRARPHSGLSAPDIKLAGTSWKKTPPMK